jgi:HK97 gp10 family phage protein
MSGSLAAPGLVALRQRLDRLPEEAEAEIGDALNQAAQEMVAAVRDRLGRISPSSRGDPPADPQGELASSLSVTIGPGELKATLAVAAHQAVFLEYGTRRMAARPFLRPAISVMQSSARDELRAALARVGTRLGGSS